MAVQCFMMLWKRRTITEYVQKNHGLMIFVSISRNLLRIVMQRQKNTVSANMSMLIWILTHGKVFWRKVIQLFLLQCCMIRLCNRVTDVLLCQRLMTVLLPVMLCAVSAIQIRTRCLSCATHGDISGATKATAIFHTNI